MPSMRADKLKAEQREQQSQALVEEMEACEEALAQNPSEENVTRYNKIRAELDEAEEVKGRQAMIRSGEKWVEQGEKPSRYFFEANKQQEERKGNTGSTRTEL